MKETLKTRSVKTEQGLSVENSARTFKIVCDEPVASGGTDTGMNPCEALLSALGSCMTIAAFYLAPSQGIKLEYFGVDAEGDIDTDGFMGKDPSIRPGFQAIRLTPHIKCDANDDDARAFVEFVKSRCPVSNCLAEPVPTSIENIVVE